ncbi:BolA family protein [Gluconobacter wancherniae]|uniref:ATP-binding protein n=1 Tax=Gluconobacter wancherniae NBRC 103581 TaxID=656744 RepID=A0A511B0D8_9PROT|nr:BolA family transcriptional regulator [Gluconobacter wancherniae]MBF0853442.1 BolA family transcriptional regulator [Gluconobacter wancherniae]MBS1088256.1 BolA family transcriptional regulator [Gluconobacter wancherniae]MBS1093942.1 BolA family transcriptional regulator [Gluconobacter wancherniae]GBD55826.1 ATP-binding protein [Gluconobacter wancherniae NBRC 103581]GBR66069.1 BolA-like protein [Gluconobacter wancherniae NBRC 103581]
MPMTASEIERTILAAIPDAQITVEDLAGDGDHYACTVVSEVFRGRTRVAQHKLVYEAFGTRMGTELHAMALKTLTP